MGRSRRQSSPPPQDFCRGLSSAGNWYGLWPHFHDAQAPNGQYKHTSAGEHGFLVEIFCLFSSRFLEKFLSLPTKHSLQFTYKHKRCISGREKIDSSYGLGLPYLLLNLKRTIWEWFLPRTTKAFTRLFGARNLTFLRNFSNWLTRHSLKRSYKHKRQR